MLIPELLFPCPKAEFVVPKLGVSPDPKAPEEVLAAKLGGDFACPKILFPAAFPPKFEDTVEGAAVLGRLVPEKSELDPIPPPPPP